MTPPLRLQVFPKLPTYEVVCFIMQQALSSPGRAVELPFIWEEKVVPYLLTATSPGSGSPEWIFTTDGRDAPIIWTHTTGDVGSILNMVVSECKGAAEETLDHRTSYTNLPALSQLGQSSPRARKPTRDSLVRFQVAADELKSSKGRGVTLEGDLSDVPIFSLLQSVNITKMSGKLEITGPDAQAEVYFQSGLPVHAVTLHETGDRAVVEMVLIEQGKFRFIPHLLANGETVKKRLDALLMEGAVLLDQVSEMAKYGLDFDAYIARKNPALGESEFERAVKGGLPLDLVAQKRFYASLEGNCTLFELMRSGKIGRADVIPFLFNLWSCNLVSFSSKPLRFEQRGANDASVGSEEALIAFNSLILRQDTGLLPYPLFLHFLNLEHARFERSGLPYAILIFDVMKMTAAGLEPVSATILKLIAARISQVKRKYDLLAHFQTFECALLLPMADTREASVVAQRMSALISEVCNERLTEEGEQIIVSIGVAAISEACSQPSTLLAAALDAKSRASGQSSNVVVYGTR